MSRKKLTRDEIKARNTKKVADRIERTSGEKNSKEANLKNKRILAKGKRLIANIKKKALDREAEQQALIEGLQKDLELMESVESWDTLTRLLDAAKESIAGIANEVAELVNVTSPVSGKKIVSYIAEEDRVAANISMKGYMNDIEHFISAIEKIAAQHEGRTGPVTDPNDLATVLTIYQEYGELQDKLNAVLLPSMSRFIAYLSEARYAIEKEIDQHFKETKEVLTIQ